MGSRIIEPLLGNGSISKIPLVYGSDVLGWLHLAGAVLWNVNALLQPSALASLVSGTNINLLRIEQIQRFVVLPLDTERNRMRADMLSYGPAAGIIFTQIPNLEALIVAI